TCFASTLMGKQSAAPIGATMRRRKQRMSWRFPPSTNIRSGALLRRRIERDDRGADPQTRFALALIRPVELRRLRRARRWQGRRTHLAPPQPTTELHMVSAADRVSDERVTCLRIFADAAGETHMEDVDMAFQPRKLFKDNPPRRLSDNFPSSWFNI